MTLKPKHLIIGGAIVLAIAITTYVVLRSIDTSTRPPVDLRGANAPLDDRQQTVANAPETATEVIAAAVRGENS